VIAINTLEPRGKARWVPFASATVLFLVGVYGQTPSPGSRGASARTIARVASPDGQVRVTLARDAAGRLTHQLTFKDRPVLEPAPIALAVDGVALTDGVTAAGVEKYTVDERYPWRGVHSTAVDRANGVRVSLRHDATGTRHSLDLRVFDDGVAFRHGVPGDASAVRTPDETTSFVFPAGATAWYHDFENHYESMYVRKDVAGIQAGEWAAPPIAVKLPNGLGYAAVTEGGLARFSGMGLQANGRRGFDIRLGHAQPLNYPFRLRYGEEEGKRLATPATVTGEITTPWRVVMVGADLDALVTSDIVHNVSAPPNAALFPQGLATPWVKPGRSLWRYLDGGDNSFEGMKEYARFAAALGFEYNLLEGFWQKWPEAQLRELVDYSKAQGVGIWLWKHSRDLRTPDSRRDFFALCRRVGAVGVKLDFFDHEAREVVELYEVLLREAAAHRLMVNFHGANKPAGESRTWPNELTREAVYGFERTRTPLWARHNTTLPFARYLAGHGDYTPVVFGDRRRETSWAHQIATAAVFTSPLLVYGAHPKSLVEHPAVEVIKQIPAVWDETRVLPFSEIGEVAGMARRNGDLWVLAVINGPEGRQVKIPLTFLARGPRSAILVRDTPDEAAAVAIEKTTVSRDTVLTVDLRAGGGFVATIR
jgi:alpha-glucosidase